MLLTLRRYLLSLCFGRRETFHHRNLSGPTLSTETAGHMISYMAEVLRWSFLLASIALLIAACSGERELVSNTMEEEDVQTGMSAMMADREVTSLAPSTHSTNSWIANPTGTGTIPLYPTYLRDPDTTCYYCWNSTGMITRQDKYSATCGTSSARAAIPHCLVQMENVSRDPFFDQTNYIAEIAAIVVAAIVLLGTLRWLRRKRNDSLAAY